ncbi:MAG: ThiF family adenylyltransferase [Myxococcota bacterium]
MTTFDYATFTGRNLGFVSEDEQRRIREAHVFVSGVGGLGGSALMCLVRAGIGRITITDVNAFDLSNLNRQMVATLDTIGEPKAETTAAAIAQINPECEVAIIGTDWVDQLDAVLPQATVVINGCDDQKATIAMMRKAEEHKRTVVDSFSSPLPSVYVVHPHDPRPEVTFRYPSVGKSLDEIDDVMLATCFEKEVEYVMVHSSSADHLDLDVAAQVVAGKRARPSFAPMVWTTGCLMAYEALRVVLERPGGPGFHGTFFNPWTWQVERPRHPVVGAIRRFFIRRLFARLTNPS